MASLAGQDSSVKKMNNPHRQNLTMGVVLLRIKPNFFVNTKSFSGYNRKTDNVQNNGGKMYEEFDRTICRRNVHFISVAFKTSFQKVLKGCKGELFQKFPSDSNKLGIPQATFCCLLSAIFAPTIDYCADGTKFAESTVANRV